MSIPKVIHYIWLGGKEEPTILKKCKDSWKKYCPDYEIKRWDESNLNIDCCQYCRQAYAAKKYAFASDVLRLWILKEFGGIYVDIDVEFIKNIDKFLKYDAFSGFESSGLVNPGVIIGSIPNNKFIVDLFNDYQKLKFEFNPKNQITICNIVTNKLISYGLKCNNTTQNIDGFQVFASDFFSPKSLTDGKIRKTKNTTTIHHFEGTWLTKHQKFKSRLLMFIKRLIGEELVSKLKERKNINKKTEQKSEKQKLLHILSSDKYSGAENVACQIISLFKDECEIAYSSPDGQISESLKERNIRFIPLSKMSKSEVKKAIKEFQPDIIHAHDPRAICICASIKTKAKIIAHIHSNRPDFKKLSLNSIIFNHYSIKKKVDKIIWVSNSCLNDYCFNKNIANKSIVLNNIINQDEIIEKSKNCELNDKSDIVFLGRLTYPKNPQRLISIIKMVSEKIPDIKASIIGDGDLMKECLDLTKQLELENNIKFYGFQSNGFGLLKNSKLFLMTSRFEGNPMCILEAETLGLPIIAPEISELKTTVKKGISGFLYNSDEECVDIILDLLNNEEKYKYFKKTTLDFSKEYNNLENYKNNLKNIYGL